MARALALALLLALMLASSRAQADTIEVSGRVAHGAEPVEAGIVAMLNPEDSSIVAYDMTGKQGIYSIRTATRLGEVLLRVTGFNVRRQIKRIRAATQRVDFAVDEESRLLREVQVKAQKLWGSRDTLNYLVSAYTRQGDRTIGDVLRQLPGITIDGDGTIKYQGMPINRFYIENLDMLQGRYNLATDGIKATDVATIQVLEHNQHVKALRDQTPPESAAINLKLKDKAKGTWSKSADLGAGADGDGGLWSATLQAMYFSAREQHMLRYSGDNLGRGLDAAAAHYGQSAAEASPLVSIVEHGSSPVGNSLLGYRHGVNLNNLAKLSNQAMLTYNLNYGHRLARGSSFQRTTYILSDGSSLLLAENLSDRTHTDAASLQITYEDNGSRRYLGNTFTFSGNWDEGRGAVSSAGNSGQRISQALHCRSLAISDRMRLVSRSAGGGGFEWNSENSLSSSPQALAIGGDMSARQGAEVAAFSTRNGFETLRNLRAHCFSLSASAQANAAYTSATSLLSHAGSPVSPRGDMKHLRAELALGPVAKYAGKAFQAEIRLPVALGYTHLDNANITGETTDAHRLRLRFQPSLSMLWRVTPSFTLDGGAGYSATETPWQQLLTSTIMQNYRSLSRYRAALSDSYAAIARLKASYKDLFSGLFAHIEGSWHHSWSDIAYGTSLDSLAHTIVEAAHAPHHGDALSLSAYGRKDFAWHTTQLEMKASATRGRTLMLRQSTMTRLRTAGYTLGGTLALDIVKGCRIDYGATWAHHRSSSPGYSDSYDELAQRGRLSVSLVPSRLLLNVNASHTHCRQLASSRKDYLFAGAGLKWKLSKAAELSLDGENLANISTYCIHTLGDMEENYAEYHLRPWSVVLSAHISL